MDILKKPLALDNLFSCPLKALIYKNSGYCDKLMDLLNLLQAIRTHKSLMLQFWHGIYLPKGRHFFRTLHAFVFNTLNLLITCYVSTGCLPKSLAHLDLLSSVQVMLWPLSPLMSVFGHLNIYSPVFQQPTLVRSVLGEPRCDMSGIMPEVISVTMMTWKFIPAVQVLISLL